MREFRKRIAMLHDCGILNTYSPRSIMVSAKRLLQILAAKTFHRTQLKQAVPHLLARWEPLLGVKVERFFIQRMKTKWGSCNSKARTIRLNTELAKKPAECLGAQPLAGTTREVALLILCDACPLG